MMWVYHATGMMVRTPEMKMSRPPIPATVHCGVSVQHRTPADATPMAMTLRMSDASISPRAICMIWAPKYCVSCWLQRISRDDVKVLQMSHNPCWRTRSEDSPGMLLIVRQAGATVLVSSRIHPQGASTIPKIKIPGVLMINLGDLAQIQKSPAGNELLCFRCLKSRRATETSSGRIKIWLLLNVTWLSVSSTSKLL